MNPSSPIARGAGALLLALLAPAPRADSPLDRQSPVLADLILEPSALSLTVRIRERDLPMLRGSVPPDCDLPCAARRVVRVSVADSADLTATESAITEATTGEPDHRAQIQFRFPLAKPPRQFELSGGVPGLIPALLVLQQGVPVSDRVPLDGPARLKLDWRNPWNSAFQGRDWGRRHLQPKSFIYIEPHEIRHEWLQPLAWLPAELRHALGVDTANPISPGARTALKSRVLELLPRLLTLEIDGQPAVPLVDRLEFVRQGPAGIEPVPADATLPANAAQLGIMLAYPLERPPASLRLDWRAFSPEQATHGIQVIRGQETLDTGVTATHPQMDWSAEDMLDAPVPADAAPGDSAGSDAPLNQDALSDLLLNAYRAFSIRDEEAAYDRLAQSLASPLLDQVYLDQRLALIRKARGLGGDSRVQRVELTRFEPLPSEHAALRIDASWVAHGQVSHWGHAHDRHTRYRAIVGLRRNGAGAWRIDTLDFIDGQGLDAT